MQPRRNSEPPIPPSPQLVRDRLRLLRELAAHISASGDLGEQLQRSVDRIRDLAGAAMSAAIVLDPQTGQPKEMLHAGFPADVAPPPSGPSPP